MIGEQEERLDQALRLMKQQADLVCEMFYREVVGMPENKESTARLSQIHKKIGMLLPECETIFSCAMSLGTTIPDLEPGTIHRHLGVK